MRVKLTKALAVGIAAVISTPSLSSDSEAAGEINEIHSEPPVVSPDEAIFTARAAAQTSTLLKAATCGEEGHESTGALFHPTAVAQAPETDASWGAWLASWFPWPGR